MRDQVQLIAYADRLGGTLAGLRQVLDGPLASAFGGVHVLPFFTPYDGADAGFDTVDHLTVDPRLGTWDDIAALAADRDVVVDVIVNHVSVDSAQCQDWLRRGDSSPHAAMFLTLGRVFPDGATEAQLAVLYRPRPGLPFTPVTVAGERRLAWTTFTSQQIDIDVTSEAGAAYLAAVLDVLARAGVSTVRLDAVGYAVKTPGSTCFMTPETFTFIDELSAQARRLGMEVLVEVHAHHQHQIEIGGRVDRVYDFALPPLVLHMLTTGDSEPLCRWMQVRPRNAVTVLDTHDGIGVVDVASDAGRPGLLDDAQVHALVEGIHERTGGASRAATGAAASNVDLYQVNSTFYAALGGDDTRYLVARAVQLFTPGVPQVYYVGALAGDNDTDLLAATGVGRDINRHVYTAAEIDANLQRRVVQSLLALCRFRNEHPAFAGEHELTTYAELSAAQAPGPGTSSGTSTQDGLPYPGSFRMTWRHGDAWTSLDVDPGRPGVVLRWTDGADVRTTCDLRGEPPVATSAQTRKAR